MNKICKECNVEKPVTEFYRDKLSAGGYRNNCKECKNKKTMKWRSENREHYNATARKHHKKHYQKFRLQRYDLVPEQHQQMLQEQKEVCAICGEPPKGKRPLAVDHCHSTGKVRGLLCYGCNRLIVALDNHPLYTKTMEYLKKG